MKFLKYFLSLTLILGPYAQAWDQATSKVVQVDQASGVSSTPNYWKSGDAELTLAGVATYNDGAVDKPVDCTGGSPTITAARSSTAPMYDKQSWLITKPASNVQGQGIAFEFDVDNGVAAVEMMDLMFEYIVGSGTFTAGSDTTNSDLMVYIYDVTAGQLIEPKGGSKLYTSSTTLKGDYRGWFQSTLGSKKYRVCLHQATTSASAYTLKVDAGKVQKSKQVVGTIITTPVLFTPTGSLTTNATYTGTWFQVGNFLEQETTISFSGANTQGVLNINLPQGLSIDNSSSGIDTTSFNTVIGITGGLRTASIAWDVSAVTNGTTNSFRVVFRNVKTDDAGSASDPVKYSSIDTSANLPVPISSGDVIKVRIRVPIAGWSAGARMSDGYDGRVLTATASLSSTQTISSASSTKITINSSVEDSAGMFDSVNNRIYIRSSGYYDVDASTQLTGSTLTNNEPYVIFIRLNGSSTLVASTQPAIANTTFILGASRPGIKLNAGDYIELNVQSTSDTSYEVTGNINTRLTVKSSGGTPFMAPTASVAVHYAGTAGDAIGTSDSLIKFTTKEDDTHNAYNPATGIFTAPEPGRYSVSWSLATGVLNLSTSQRYNTLLYKNGTSYKLGQRSLGNGSANNHTSSGAVSDIYLKQGETLSIYGTSDVATTAATGSSAAYLTIVKTGP